jgi:hypothetical protein
MATQATTTAPRGFCAASFVGRAPCAEDDEALRRAAARELVAKLNHAA